MEYIIIALRIVTIMLLLLFSTLLIMGKRPIGELPVFDFLSLVVIGAIVGADIADPAIKHLPTAFAVVILALLQRIISELMLKYRKINKLFTFEPTIIITNGQFIFKNIKKIKYTIEEVLMLLRDKDVFDVSQIDYAIIEPNGKLSVVRKPIYDQVIKKDINIFNIESDIPVVVLLERKMVKESLAYLNMTEDEFIELLSSKGYPNYRDLFLVTLSKNKKISISTYHVKEDLLLR